MTDNSSQPVTNHSTEQGHQRPKAQNKDSQPVPRRKPRRSRRRGVPDDQDGDHDEVGGSKEPQQPASQQPGSQNKPQSSTSKRNQPKLDRTDPRFIPRGMFFLHDDRAGVTNAPAVPVALPVEEKKPLPERKPRQQQRPRDEPKWQHDRFLKETGAESSSKNISESRGGRGRARGRGSNRGKSVPSVETPSADSSVPVINISLDSHQLAASNESVNQNAVETELSSRGRRRSGRGRGAQTGSLNHEPPRADQSVSSSSGRSGRRRQQRHRDHPDSSQPSLQHSTVNQLPSNPQPKQPSQATSNHAPSQASAPRPYASSAVPSVALVLGEDIPPHNFGSVSQQPAQRRPPLTGHRAQRPTRPGALNPSNSANGTSSTSPSPPPTASASSSINLNPNAKEFVSHSSPGPMQSSPNGMVDPMVGQFFQPIGAHVASPPHAAVPTFLYGPYGYVQASPPPLSISPVPYPGYDGVSMVDVGMQGMTMDPNYPQQPYLPYPPDPYGYEGTVSPPPVSMMQMMPHPYGMPPPMYMMGSDDGMNPGLSFMGQTDQLSPTAMMGYLPPSGPIVPTPSPPNLPVQAYHSSPPLPAATGRPDSRVQPLPASVAGRKKPPRFVDAE